MKTVFKILAVIIFVGTAQSGQASNHSKAQPKSFSSYFKSFCCSADQNPIIPTQITIIPLTETAFLVSCTNAQGDEICKKYTKVALPQKTDEERAQEKERRTQKTIHAVNNSSRHGLTTQCKTDHMNSILYGPTILRK